MARLWTSVQKAMERYSQAEGQINAKRDQKVTGSLGNIDFFPPFCAQNNVLLIFKFLVSVFEFLGIYVLYFLIMKLTEVKKYLNDNAFTWLVKMMISVILERLNL